MQNVMQNNLVNLPKLGAAADAANCLEAAGYLLSIAQGMNSIREYTPLRGGKAAFQPQRAGADTWFALLRS